MNESCVSSWNPNGSRSVFWQWVASALSLFPVSVPFWRHIRSAPFCAKFQSPQRMVSVRWGCSQLVAMFLMSCSLLDLSALGCSPVGR